MKKKFLAVTMALCLSCVPFAAYAEETETEIAAVDSVGEAGEITAESLLAGTDAETPDSVSGDMAMNLDASLDIEMDGATTSLDIAMTGDFTMQVLENPVQLALNGTYTVELLGETEEIGMEMYLVMAEDYSTADIYVKVDNGSSESEWQHTQATDAQLKEALGLSESDDLSAVFTDEGALLDELGMDWTLEEADDAYTVSSSVSLNDILSSVGTQLEDELASAGLSEDEQAIITDCLNGIVLNMSYTYDKDELLPTAFHMDMNDSDLSALNDYISSLFAVDTSDSEDETESETTYTIALNDFSIDGNYTYNDVTEIEVPADALTTPAESVSDASEGLSITLSDDAEAETEAES